MSRCFPFPPPGYENEKKLSNGELGHVHKKSKHKHEKGKKDKKREREDEVQVDYLIEKKDKKHKHHKHKKDKRKGRHGEHEFEDSKNTGVAHDSPTRGETFSFKFVERERPGTCCCNKGDTSHGERSRQIKDEVRDNEMGGNPKMDKDRDSSDCNVRKRKAMDTIFFAGLGDAEENFNKSETIGIKFVERERLGNGKRVKIDLSEREESRQNNCQTTANGMEKDQKIGKDRVKSNGKVMKGKQIDTKSPSHGGNKRGALSIKFVDKETCNGKCDNINPLNNEKFRTDRDDNIGIVMKRNEINTNSYSEGNRPWEHLPMLMDKDKWSNKQIQTTFVKEVYSDIGRATQEAKNLLVECISMSHVQNASNHVLGKSVDSTSFHPSFSGRDNCFLKSFQSTFTKEASFSTGKVAKEVKDCPIECIRKTRLEESTKASFKQCIASTSSHPLFSGKDKQFNKCHQAISAKKVHSDSQNKVQDAQCCDVGLIRGSKVQEVTTDHLEKCAASVNHHSATNVKKKVSNNVSQTASFEGFHTDSWREVQDSKECAVECIPENRTQLASNAGLKKCVSSASLKKCVASTSCHLSFAIKDKLSIKHPQTALTEKAQFDSGRRGQDTNGVAVECKPGSRAQEASTLTLQTCVISTSCSPFSGKDCERNGMADYKAVSHFIGHSHGTIEAVDVSSESRADCKITSHFLGNSHGATEAVPSRIRANCNTTAHFIGPSHVTTEAVDAASSGSQADCKATSHFIGPSHSTTKADDIVPSESRADEHILNLKHFPSLPPKQLCSDLDDQSWLFLSNKKTKATEKFGHASVVWDRLLVLQPTNTYALPYVSPF